MGVELFERTRVVTSGGPSVPSRSRRVRRAGDSSHLRKKDESSKRDGEPDDEVGGGYSERDSETFIMVRPGSGTESAFAVIEQPPIFSQPSWRWLVDSGATCHIVALRSWKRSCFEEA